MRRLDPFGLDPALLTPQPLGLATSGLGGDSFCDGCQVGTDGLSFEAVRGLTFVVALTPINLTQRAPATRSKRPIVLSVRPSANRTDDQGQESGSSRPYSTAPNRLERAKPPRRPVDALSVRDGLTLDGQANAQRGGRLCGWMRRTGRAGRQPVPNRYLCGSVGPEPCQKQRSFGPGQ